MSFAQEMKVLSFNSRPQDLFARTQQRTDLNGDPCALIKVQIPRLTDVIFEGSVVDAIYTPGEYLVYVPAGTKRIKVKHKDFLPLEYEFPEKIEGNVTYEMVIQLPQTSVENKVTVQGQFVSFVVSPPDAYLEFDGKPLQLMNGQTSTANPVPFGVYSYKVEAKNYHPENGKVEVNDPDNSIIVNVSLKPAYGSLVVSGESARGGTVYLDKENVGTAPVSLEIVPSGKHMVKVAKDMYNLYEAEIEIKDGQKTIVSPIMQPNFQNITFKVDGNAEIWINGKLRGTGSVKDDFEAGTLFVECKKENHRTTSANYPSVAGALPTTITLASPIPIHGVLLVKSNPIGADVFVDDENKGKTPKQLAQTIIGEHKVRIFKEGYLPYEETVTILEGQSLTVETDLTENEQTYINAKLTSNANNYQYNDDGEKIYRIQLFALSRLKSVESFGIPNLKVREVNGIYKYYLGDFSSKSEANGILASLKDKYPEAIVLDINSSVVRTTGTLNGHEWVDLGLPSGTKWATCNVGANAPEEYGDYFAWGETKTKNSYTESNYNYKNNSTKLPTNADAASANWGSGWRMPAEAEFDELRTRCTWTRLSNGYKVVGSNGNSIFLPAAGYREKWSILDAGSGGYYWSSSLNTDNSYRAWYLYFFSVSIDKGNYRRYYGRSVRPVCNSR